jgi:hypothetical protein
VTDRAFSPNIEHLVFGTYKARPSTPLNNDDNRINCSSNQSIPNSPISENNDQNLDQLCECRAHSRNRLSVDSQNNDNKIDSKLSDLTPNKRCNACDNALPHDNSLMDNKNELDLKLTNEDMDLDSSYSSKEDDSLISAIEHLTTNEKPNGLNSKIPQSISKKQIRNISTSSVKQMSGDSLNGFLSFDREVNESVGSILTKESDKTNAPNNSSKTLISHIPKPLINMNSGPKNMESFKSFGLFTDKTFISNNQLISNIKRPMISPFIQRSLEMPVIPNLHLLKNSQLTQLSSFDTSINQLSDLRFAKIRSTIHANKRMPALNTNSLRRHNSLDTTHKSFNSYQTRLKQTKVFNEKSIFNDSRIYKESRISNNSMSQFTKFSAETRKISSKSDKNGVNHSTSYSEVMESFSSINEELESAKREVIKTKSHSNLQRNRPQVKAPIAGRIRVSLKSRSNSNPDSKVLPSIDRGVSRASSDSTQNSSQKSQNSVNYNENFKTSDSIDSNSSNKYSHNSGTQFESKEPKLYNSKMMKMFIMDEDNIPVSPKKLSKTNFISHKKDQNVDIREEKNSDKSTFKQYLYETYVNKMPPSAQSSPKQPNTPSIKELRPRSSSEHHLSNLLLSEAQKEAIDDLKKSTKRLSKSSRPWSHIYSDSEAKRILKSTKSYGEIIENMADLGSNNKHKSENDILSTSVEQNSFINDKLPISPVRNRCLQSPTSVDNGSQESVLQRFKKTFSLRFTRHNVNSRNESPVQTKLRSSTRSKSEGNGEKLKRSTWYDLNGQTIDDKCDVKTTDNSETNRKLSNTECEDLKYRLIKVPSVERQFSTPYPIKVRDQTHRKSLVRKHSQRARLRRSLSHPQKLSSSNRIQSRENSSRVSSDSDTDTESLSGNQNSSASHQSSEQQEVILY